MSHPTNTIWEENLQELQQEPASDKDLQSEVLVEETKEKLDLYKEIVKENDNSLIDRMWNTIKPEKEYDKYEAKDHEDRIEDVRSEAYETSRDEEYTNL